MGSCRSRKISAEGSCGLGLTQTGAEGGTAPVMQWADVMAAFESCGVSRIQTLLYPLPYIFAVLPKMLESRAGMFPFFSGSRTKENPAPDTEAKGLGGKLRAQDVLEVFSGLF
jgi:hypothetical protein